MAAASQFKINYVPKIKGIGFCPNPIARFGIPAYADSVTNPKVIGTAAHEDWWNEQIKYCTEGYSTGGVYIPGRYYYYLNFCLINTVGRGFHNPDFVDLDQDFFLLVDHVKKQGVNKGIIALKKRRAGLSEKVAKGIMCYGLLFRPEKYTAGICAGLEDYTIDFTTKVKENNSNMPPELYLHFLTDNNDEYAAGWVDKKKDARGSQNTIKMATMFNNPNVFKGKALDDCVFEEAGEFKMLLRGYSATKACFQVAGKMVGTPFVYGTGGKITSATKEFQAMWSDAEHYFLEKFFVPGPRLYVGSFVGSHDETSEVPDKCPNVFKMAHENGLSYEQILGCEDVDYALMEILSTRKFLSGAKNTELFYEHFHDFGLTEAEMFLKFSGNNFDPQAIAEQTLKLASSPRLLYNRYILEYDRNEKGELKMPLRVTPRVISDEEMTPELEQQVVYIRFLPVKGYINIFAAGADSYDQDVSKTSKSLGAMMIIARRGHPYKNENGEKISHKRVPVLLIRNRPKRKEIFYDNCMKASILFNLIGATLIDASKAMIIQHYKDNGCTKYLAPRPRAFEAEDSTQTHDYGILLTANSRSKPQMISMIQSWVLDELDECVFEQIPQGLSEYDVIQKDSDWDEIDSLGLSLIQDVAMSRKPISNENDEADGSMDWPDWQERNGILVDVSDKKDKSGKPTKDLFLRLLENGEFNNEF